MSLRRRGPWAVMHISHSVMGVVVTTGAVIRAKFQSNRHRQQTNTQLFTSDMPFCRPTTVCQSTEGKGVNLTAQWCVNAADKPRINARIASGGVACRWTGRACALRATNQYRCVSVSDRRTCMSHRCRAAAAAAIVFAVCGPCDA